MTDSDKVGGGSWEAAGWGDTPLPVVRTMRFGSSETSPAPLCQIPAWEFSSVPTPDSSLHMEVMALVEVLTPTTMPRYGVKSQSEAKAMYTVPFNNSSAGRCSSVESLNGTPGVLYGVPVISTGNPGASRPVVS